MKKKFHIIIFGCQMNYSDAARIKAILINSGLEYVEEEKDADIVIIDTCSVRQKSEDKVTGKLKEIDPSKKIRITGCMIQHNLRNSKISQWVKNKKTSELMRQGNFIGNIKTTTPTFVGRTNQEVKDIAEQRKNKDNIVYVNHVYNPMFFNIKKSYENLELFFRIDDTWFLPLMLEHLGYEVNPDVEIINEYTGIIPHNTNQRFKENTKTAYVPISTGCSQFCAYCIVPYARWLEKNLDEDKVVAEAKHHLDNGVEEIVLLGQIVNKHPNFVQVCKRILKLPWLKRLRYTSPYPTYCSKELLELHENEEKMCPHIHMPLQSWSNKILKKMFRGYTAEEYLEFVHNIRWLKREISITSDIIVWFCDEEEEDFQASLELTKQSLFDMVYIGIYSPRPWTLGARKYEDNVPKKIKKERRVTLNAMLVDISLNNNKKEIGKNREIIINKIGEDRIGGYADNMKNVIIKGIKNTDLQLGQFTQIKVIEAEPFKLVGSLL